MSKSESSKTGAEWVASMLQGIAALLLVLSAAMSAMSYFVGALFQEKMARLVGLAKVPENDSLQWTIVQGARVLVDGDNLGAIVIICGILTLLCLGLYTVPPIRRLREKVHAERMRLAAEEPTPGKQPSTAALSGLGAALLGLLWLIGSALITSAEADAYEEHVLIMRELGGACGECTTYQLDERFVVGVPLFQTERTLFVLNRRLDLQVIEIENLRYAGLFVEQLHTEEAEGLWKGK
jgi:hypothetical protein